MKQQKDSISSYGKFKFKDSLARNMLSKSNIDHCLAHETLVRVYEYICKVQVQRLFSQKYVKQVNHGPLSVR